HHRPTVPVTQPFGVRIGLAVSTAFSRPGCFTWSCGQVKDSPATQLAFSHTWGVVGGATAQTGDMSFFTRRIRPGVLATTLVAGVALVTACGPTPSATPPVAAIQAPATSV